jgi:hypothetical protein
MNSVRLFEKLGAGHLGHPLVGDDESDWLALALQALEIVERRARTRVRVMRWSSP